MHEPGRLPFPIREIREIRGVRTARLMVAFGWSADEVVSEQHAHLSLGQIHAVLGYYYYHQQEIDAQIEQDLQRVRALRVATGEAPMQRRLRAAALAR